LLIDPTVVNSVDDVVFVVFDIRMYRRWLLFVSNLTRQGVFGVKV